jgi:drug/metabolite transporter (DMT)-like permease
MRPLPARSLLLTGLGDVLSGLRERSRRPGEGVGLILMVVSAASFALMAAFAKWLLPDTPSQAIVLSRGTLMSLVFVIWARRRGVSLLGKDPAGLLLRGLLGYGALSCYFWSVQHLPLGDAVLLQYSHPAFVAALAPRLLGERTGRWHWPLVVAAFVGVSLIVGATGQIRVSALVGLGGAMGSGLAYLAVRRLTRTEDPLTIMAWFPLVTVAPSLLAVLRIGKAALPTTGTEVAGHLLVTVAGLLGQIALTFGLARADAARGTAVTMTGPVFGALYGFLLFGTIPAAASAAGTVVVIASVVLLARHRPAT